FEAKTFLSVIEGGTHGQIGKAETVTGKIGGEDVMVAIIGMGMPHAALRAKKVIEELRSKPPSGGNSRRYAPGLGAEEQREENTTTGGNNPKLKTRNPKLSSIRGVILAGFAGALHPDLKLEEIFVTAGAEYLLPLLPEAERPRVAKLATVEKIAATAAGKKELFEQTGAELVDMEQSHVAQVVQEFGLPFIGIRIVSDDAHADLPADTLSQSYNQETGEYTPWKLAGHLTRNPFKIATLASFVRPLPSIRNRMSRHLHTWLMQTGPRLFR
ncbi:MAG TPA: hypothetical protein VK737_10575, partial [Opitutales bacterium]|nr:hypothetical protein [Opitutales bacterium]